jgi:hypothetical protein
MTYGDRVKIKSPSRNLPLSGLDLAFEGQLGTIIDIEDGRPKMFRIRLDSPVAIEGLGLVRDDLWAREYFRPTQR